MRLLLSFFLFFCFLSPGLTQEENSPSEANTTRLEDSLIVQALPSVMKLMIERFIAENPFSLLSEEEVKSMIVVQTQGTPFGKTLDNHPKVLAIMVAFLRDKKALPSFFNILNRPAKMKKYSYIVLVFFILIFIINLLNNSPKFWKRALKKLGTTIFFFLGNIAIFYFIFLEELAPTIQIIRMHL